MEHPPGRFQSAANELAYWLREMYDWQAVLDQEHDDRLAYDYQYRAGEREPQDVGQVVQRLRTAQHRVKALSYGIKP